MSPNYKKIFEDIIKYQHPLKADACERILKKESLTGMDVITLNNLIFGSQSNWESIRFNQKHRSYDRQSIVQILDYQKKNNLNNTQIALKYKLSRNTVAKWKKLCLNQNIE